MWHSRNLRFTPILILTCMCISGFVFLSLFASGQSTGKLPDSWEIFFNILSCSSNQWPTNQEDLNENTGNALNQQNSSTKDSTQLISEENNGGKYFTDETPYFIISLNQQFFQDKDISSISLEYNGQEMTFNGKPQLLVKGLLG